MRLIDADALKDAFCMFCKALESHEVDCKGDCITHDIIDDEPTIEAEPVRHGRCVRGQEGQRLCSVCNEHDNYMIYHKYCPHCGAKMDLKEGAENA